MTAGAGEGWFCEMHFGHLRGLPDGSLSQADVNAILDYVEKLEAKYVRATQQETDQMIADAMYPYTESGSA